MYGCEVNDVDLDLRPYQPFFITIFYDQNFLFHPSPDEKNSCPKENASNSVIGQTHSFISIVFENNLISSVYCCSTNLLVVMTHRYHKLCINKNYDVFCSHNYHKTSIIPKYIKQYNGKLSSNAILTSLRSRAAAILRLVKVSRYEYSRPFWRYYMFSI